MPLEWVLAGILLVALVAYALLGGADFGGGVWDLLATGPRARQQRALIADAIGPVWEANHVWLLAVIVILFTCFPSAYATISTALHLPLSLMLLGIVLRGASFVFRAYDTQRDDVYTAWSRAFAVGSVIAPFFLGVSLGAAVSGRMLTADGEPVTHLLAAWAAPLPLAAGLFVVAVFAFLAAIYLLHETDDPALQEDFRTRALGAAAAVTVLAWVVFGLAIEGAPRLVEGLWRSWWAPPFHAATGALGAGVLFALAERRYGLARTLGAALVAGVTAGFCAAQFPYIVAPGITFTSAAAPRSVLVAVTTGLVGGLITLLPAYVWMMRVFKHHTLAARARRG
jgi:cytochrome d ubiquinol oxidase subunit II